MYRKTTSALVLILSGCASNGAQYNVDYRALSSQLYVEGPDGSMIEPLSGQIVGIAGLNIGRDAISIVPGIHWVRTSCPPTPGALQGTHGQSVQNDFIVGKAYVLRCRNGHPVIEPHE